MLCVKEAPDSERIPTPDESGVRVVGAAPTYSVHYRDAVEPFGNEYEGALERSRELGYEATVVRDHDGAVLSVGSAPNPLREAYRYVEEAERKGRLSERQAEKIHRGMA